MWVGESALLEPNDAAESQYLASDVSARVDLRGVAERDFLAKGVKLAV